MIFDSMDTKGAEIGRCGFIEISSHKYVSLQRLAKGC